MMYENYENSTHTYAPENGLVLKGAVDVEVQIARSTANNKAYMEMMHRMKVMLLKKQVLADLAAGKEDSEMFKFSEMVPKDSENLMRFITISLPDCDIEKKVEFCNKKIQSLVFIPKGARWVYEQRGSTEDELGKGLHIHLIWPYKSKSKPPNEIIRDIAKPLGIKQNFVDVRKPNLALSICEQYLFGDKGTPEKKQKQMYDKLMREKYNIENVYIKK